MILQISENCVRYHGALAPLGAAVLALARASTVPVAVHLDHAEKVPLVHEAVALGFTSVMYDGSTLPDEANTRTTTDIVSYCHAAGISVEAELGDVGGKDGVHDPRTRTDPVGARRFVEATGVDALAVAVGSSHAMAHRHAVLDYDLIASLRAAVDVPLVLHGSSGVSDAGLVRAVRAGLTKINIATHLNTAFTAAVRDHLGRDDRTVDPRSYVASGRDAMATEAARLLQLLTCGVAPRC